MSTDPSTQTVAETWISEEMRGALGSELARRTSFPISASDIRKWALAVYHPEAPPRYFWDRAEAERRFGGFVTPEEFNPFAWMDTDGPRDGKAASLATGVHGTELHLGIAPPATTRVLNGGTDIEYTDVRMREGDVITSVSTLLNYWEREGRLGRMLFTVTRQIWTNERGDVVKVVDGSLIRY